jgi:hypothetical protein
MKTRREVTRALCWLPPHPCARSFSADRAEDEHGSWTRTEERSVIIGRIGWLVITETLDLTGWPPLPDLRLTALHDIARSGGLCRAGARAAVR